MLARESLEMVEMLDMADMSDGRKGGQFAGGVQSTDDSYLDLVLDYVVTNFAEEVTLDDLASAAGLSRFSLCRYFQKRFGVTPMRWLWSFRILLAHELISIEPRWSLTDIAFATGFTSSAHFSRFFRQTFAIAPSRHRRTSLARHTGSTTESSYIPFETLFASNSEKIKRAAVAALRAS